MAETKAMNIDDMTVEQYLEMEFKRLVQEVRDHADGLVRDLRKQYDAGAMQIKSMVSATDTKTPICVVLRVVSGPHIGQRFRLEGANESNEEVFKMGRSTGRLFKEKGVSLYKDKEISTTHGKIELRNGEAFFLDAKSTNGSQLNGKDVEGLIPYRLKDGDVITMGSTDLAVHLANDDKEPVSSNE